MAGFSAASDAARHTTLAACFRLRALPGEMILTAMKARADPLDEPLDGAAASASTSALMPAAAADGERTAEGILVTNKVLWRRTYGGIKQVCLSHANRALPSAASARIHVRASTPLKCWYHLPAWQSRSGLRAFAAVGGWQLLRPERGHGARRRRARCAQHRAMCAANPRAVCASAWQEIQMVQRVDEDQLLGVRTTFSESPVSVGTTHTRYLSRLHARGFARPGEHSEQHDELEQVVHRRERHAAADELSVFNETQHPPSIDATFRHPSRVLPHEKPPSASSSGQLKVAAWLPCCGGWLCAACVSNGVSCC
jgi:hypothetical protein